MAIDIGSTRTLLCLVGGDRDVAERERVVVHVDARRHLVPRYRREGGEKRARRSTTDTHIQKHRTIANVRSSCAVRRDRTQPRRESPPPACACCAQRTLRHYVAAFAREIAKHSIALLVATINQSGVDVASTCAHTNATVCQQRFVNIDNESSKHNSPRHSSPMAGESVIV